MRWMPVGMLLAIGCGPSAGTTTSDDPPTTSSSSGPTSTGEVSGSTTVADGSTTSSESTGTVQYEGFDGVCAGMLSDSWIAWQAVRDGASSTYSYSTVELKVNPEGACMPPECDTITSFEVSAGVVVSRTLEATPRNRETAPEECPEAYQEQAGALGTHPDGFPVSTLDDVHRWCCELAESSGGYREGYEDPDWLPGDVVVVVDDDGLLVRCGSQYCDFCGCTADPMVDIADLVLAP